MDAVRADGAAEILLVEDNPGDAELTREALAECGLVSNLHVVVDGVEAVAFLRQEGCYSTSVPPQLILLDLNLPRKNGFELLQEIQEHSTWRSIPVIVLTSSESESDIRKAYSLNANCYITKSMDLETFLSTVRSVKEFWFGVAKLPRSSVPSAPSRARELPNPDWETRHHASSIELRSRNRSAEQPPSRLAPCPATGNDSSDSDSGRRIDTRGFGPQVESFVGRSDPLRQASAGGAARPDGASEDPTP